MLLRFLEILRRKRERKGGGRKGEREKGRKGVKEWKCERRDEGVRKEERKDKNQVVGLEGHYSVNSLAFITLLFTWFLFLPCLSSVHSCQNEDECQEGSCQFSTLLQVLLGLHSRNKQRNRRRWNQPKSERKTPGTP